MKTQYLTIKNPTIINIWRAKGIQLEYFAQYNKTWNRSSYSLAGHGMGQVKTKWIKISAAKAKKLEPKAF
jgi:hypothetical protein